MRSPAHTIDLRALVARETLLAAEAISAAEPDAHAIHQCRVRLKRARALVKAGRECAPGLAGTFDGIAREIMQALSADRDLAALIETARSLALHEAAKSRKKRAAALSAIAVALENKRADWPDPDWATIRGAYNDLIALANVWPETSGRQLAKGVARIHKQARRAFKRGVAARSAERRHAWRKRTKARFFVAELLRGARDGIGPRRRSRNVALGRALGRERDVLLLSEQIIADPALAGGGKNAQRALRFLAKRRKKLARRADKIGRALYAA